MRWEELLSAKRCRGGQTRGRNVKSSDLRSEFEKDYHRIIGSASFRRLQDKTQVFPLDKSGACLVLQAQSQLKALYKDNMDTIIGNCDASLFLGGKGG